MLIAGRHRLLGSLFLFWVPVFLLAIAIIYFIYLA